MRLIFLKNYKIIIFKFFFKINENKIIIFFLQNVNFFIRIFSLWLHNIKYQKCKNLFLILFNLSLQLSNYLINITISAFSTVPELSLSKVANTSSNASSENSSPPPRFPRVSWTNFFVSYLSRAPELSTSYVDQIWSITPWIACSSGVDIFYWMYEIKFNYK